MTSLLWQTIFTESFDADALIEPLSDMLAAEFFGCNMITTDILRLDRLDPLQQITGNKVFKLLGHLAAYEKSSRHALVSFGGRWSNHLHALAAVSQRLNIPSFGLVRGYPEQALTATLQDCVAMGMTLKFCDKLTYAQRYDLQWRAQLSAHYDAWVIPEGGEGEEGLSGFAQLASVFQGYDEIWIAAGTGTSAQGIAPYLTREQTLRVVNVVADQGALKQKWTELAATKDWVCEWEIIEDAHLGGFGKTTPELLQLIASADAHGLPLEPVYTAKLLLAYREFLQHHLPQLRKYLLIHTGGLQGRRGYGL